MRFMQLYPNSIRSKKYKPAILPPEYRALERQIVVNPDRASVKVGAKVTMEELVDALLPQGLVPVVVPEFKGITVGGAVNGAGIESTSGLYGQFNDTCLSYTLWTGRERVYASPSENADLFYAVAGSYGTLGRLVYAEIAILPTTGFVELQYETVSSCKEACERIAQSNEPIEGIVYERDRTVLIHVVTDSPKTNPTQFTSSSSSEWFFACMDRLSKKQSKGSLVMPIRDYLFRHDRGAFWMAGLGARPRIFFRYMLHKLFGWDGGNLPTLTPAHPSFLTRTLFGDLCDSQRLYKSLHSGSEEFFKHRVVIQDFYIPQKHTPAFIDQVLNVYRIRPLWLCPVRPTRKEQIFSPHFSSSDELLIDVGVYGIPFQRNAIETTKDLEQLTSAFGGKKMLYSYNYYTPEQFWAIYPKATYEALRDKYRLHDLPDILSKVSNS